MTLKVGFVGLGIMGKPQALNLCKAGFEVYVHARRAPMMQPLVEAGATACDSPQQVAERADIIITMVSETADVEQVILGEKGVIHGVNAGDLVIDMSSISALVTRDIAAKLAEKDAHMLDAPVSGGDKGAIAGTLSIMVGGKTEQFERALPVFEAMGSNIVHIGDHGAGQITKTCNQVVITQTIAAVAEALILAKASDVDPAKVREALMGGFASSRILEIHGQRMIDHDFEPGFKIALHHKDMKIATQVAQELGVALSGANLASQYLTTLMGTGNTELDSAAMLLPLEQLSAVKLVDEEEHSYQRAGDET